MHIHGHNALHEHTRCQKVLIKIHVERQKPFGDRVLFILLMVTESGVVRGCDEDINRLHRMNASFPSDILVLFLTCPSHLTTARH